MLRKISPKHQSHRSSCPGTPTTTPNARHVSRFFRTSTRKIPKNKSMHKQVQAHRTKRTKFTKSFSMWAFRRIDGVRMTTYTRGRDRYCLRSFRLVKQMSVLTGQTLCNDSISPFSLSFLSSRELSMSRSKVLND